MEGHLCKPGKELGPEQCPGVAQHADEVKFFSPSSKSFSPALDTYDDNCSYCMMANVLENLCGA